MTHEPTVPLYSARVVRDIVNLFRERGVPAPLMEWIYGLTADEQDQLVAGGDDAWLRKRSPEHMRLVIEREDWWLTTLERALAESMRLKRAEEGGEAREHGVENGHVPGEGVSTTVPLGG